MSSLSLTDVLNAAEPMQTGLRYPVPQNWMQGRTTFGGFSSALILSAVRAQHSDVPPLCSALVNFTAPIGSPPTIETQMFRQGRNVTTINARAEVEGRVSVVGTFSFGRSQESHVSFSCDAKPSGEPETMEHFFPPDDPKLPIAFLENFDVRLVEGARPVSGAERGYLRVWARHSDTRMWNSIEGLISIADLPPPAIYPTLKKPGPSSSMNWIFNVLTEDIRTRDGWWLLEHQLTAGKDGYSSQVMRVWNTDGELVVDGMQSVIIFV